MPECQEVFQDLITIWGQVYEIVTVEMKKRSRVKDLDSCFGCHACESHCPYEAVKVYPPLGEELKVAG